MGASSGDQAQPDIQYFRKVFDASPIGIAIENLDGQPLFVNPAFCSFLGFTADELRSKHCVQFSPSEDAEKDWAFFQQLRTGSIDHYQLDKRYFRRDGSLVWGRLSLSLLNSRPSPLVIGMVEDITDRKTAELALQESEERLRLAVQAGRMFAYSWDAATDVIERSGESTEILGVEKEQADTGRAILTMVHPDDKPALEAAMAKLSAANARLQITYRMIRPDGTVVWLERNSLGYFDEHGKLKRIVGMIADVTERKKAEEALSEMNRKLIEAQEQERTRIGRELHDDIGQRLAILNAGLEQLADDPVELEARVRELRKQLTEISSDVQALSHDLHSSKLEYLGVVAGIKSWCKEFSDRNRMEVNFSSKVSGFLPASVGISLFRVLQEALHNAVKHSGVKRVEVQIMERSNEIQLSVSDSGKGFDLETAMRGTGLGLTSMRERIRLLNGTILIQSKPGSGTSIRVRVPLDAQIRCEQKAI